MGEKKDIDLEEVAQDATNSKEMTKEEERKHSRYFIGLRTVKTALAVFICLLIHFLFSEDPGLYACIAAVVCMRETPEDSWDTGLHRLYGTLIGGVLGYGMVTVISYVPVYFKGLYVAIIPLGLIVCIWLCMIVDKKNGVIIGCVVFISIGLDFAMDAKGTFYSVVLRMFETGLGIVVAGLLNRWFFPQKTV